MKSGIVPFTTYVSDRPQKEIVWTTYAIEQVVRCILEPVKDGHGGRVKTRTWRSRMRMLPLERHSADAHRAEYDSQPRRIAEDDDRREEREQ